ncbi:MAG: DUF945 family protein [Gammaproteobacteria bacterium]|nr:MAG: DUF945 family protein [Gammaproteobacteria bacterium]
MMLRLVALASLVALAVLAAPAAVGLLLEHQLGRELVRLEARQPGLTVSRAEFRRGWWQSESRQVLVFDNARRIAHDGWPAAWSVPRFELEVVSRHRHGPLAGGVPRPALAQVESQFTLGDLAGSTRISGAARSRLAWLGGIESRVIVQPLALDFTEAYGGLDLFGGEFTLMIDREFQTWVLEGRLPGGELRSAEGSLALDDGRLALRVHREGRAGHWQAALRLDTARLRAWSRRAPRGQTFGRNLTLELAAARVEDRLTLAATAGAASLSLLGRESRGLSARLGADGLSLAALQALAGGEPSAQPLLTADGRLTLDPLRAELHYGQLDGTLTLEMPPRSRGATDSDHPQAWLDGASLYSRWHLPAGLVDLAQRQTALAASVRALREQQVLVPTDDDSYPVEARYRDGLLSINGVDLQRLMGAVTAVPASRPDNAGVP